MDGESVGLGGREQRLSALLALTGRRARSQVAGILWPESTDARALASLRRAVLQTQRRSPGLLRADRTSIGLHPDVLVDVDELRAAAARVGDAEPDPALLAALVGGELLPDWYDEWVEPERERIQQQRVRALEQLARKALECGDPALVVDAARAAAGVEPLLEAASELAIRGHLERGDRASAARELERYCDLVQEELGEPPSPALVALLAPPEVAGPPEPEAAAPPPPEVAAPPRPEEAAPSRPQARRPRRVVEGRDEIADGAPRPEAARATPPLPPQPPVAVEVEPSGLTVRGAAGRLLLAASIVLAASLGVAGMGAGGPGGPGGPVGGDATGDLMPAAPSVTDRVTVPEDAPAASEEPATAVREVLVRPVTGAEGAAAFVVLATLRPARVRLEVAGPKGRDVVRNVVVRRPQGQRLVVDGLDPGTYRWSATSSSAEKVTGKVRVVAEPTVVAVAETAEPSAVAVPTEAASTTPSTTPTPTPTSTPTTTPSPTPTQQPSPTPSPSPSAPARPTSQPTDPGTTDPGPVG